MTVRYLVRRLVSVAVTLILVSAGAVLLIDLVPGDPAVVAAGDFATRGSIAAARHSLGLDKPLLPRLLEFFGHVLTGNFGTSANLNPGIPVSTIIAAALPVTISLTLVSLLIAIVIAVPVGIAAARKPGSVLDRSLTALASMFLAIPSFVVGLILIRVFAIQLGWAPALGYVPISQNFAAWMSHIILPSITLGLVSAAEIARQVRSAFVETLEQDYIRVAEAAGLKRRTILFDRALRNSAVPILTVTGFQVARILGGIVIVENIFGLPGIGTLAYNSVLRRDLPVMQGVIVVSALLIVGFSLLADVVLVLFTPNNRLQPA
jgi:peptide/nickel transport system permease protein